MSATAAYVHASFVAERLTHPQRLALKALAWGHHMHHVRATRSGRGTSHEERTWRVLERFGLVTMHADDSGREGWRGWWAHATPLGLDVLHFLFPEFRARIVAAWADA
jgi:hypothetical protein